MWNGRHVRSGQQATGLPRGLNGDFMSLRMPGVQFGDGDAVPTVSATYGTRASGLLVPIEYVRTLVPLDSIGTYLTGRDVLGRTIPMGAPTWPPSGACADCWTTPARGCR